MVLAANRGSVVISQQVRPFAWSNFDPVTRTKVITVESGLGTLVPDMIHAGASSSLGPGLAAIAAATPASLAWETANQAKYIPFHITIPITIYKMFVQNGAAVSGNFDIGIFNAAGTKVVSSGATAHAGTSVIQIVDIADTELNTGRYFLGLAFDNATAAVYHWDGRNTEMPQILGMRQQATAYTLPATATFASLTSANRRQYIPVFGATIRSDI